MFFINPDLPDPAGINVAYSRHNSGDDLAVFINQLSVYFDVIMFRIYELQIILIKLVIDIFTVFFVPIQYFMIYWFALSVLFVLYLNV